LIQLQTGVKILVGSAQRLVLVRRRSGRLVDYNDSIIMKRGGILAVDCIMIKWWYYNDGIPCR
jgi:hypothetical protein